MSKHRRHPPHAPNARHARILLPCLIAAFVAIAAFLPTLANDFTNWDDDINVTENAWLSAPPSLALGRFWTAPFRNLYIPLTYTTYLADIRIGSGAPWPFHLGNILLHALATALVCAIGLLIVQRITSRVPDSRTMAACAVGAVLFAVHPLQVEPVAWITGRKDVLCGALALLSVWLHLLALARDSWGATGPARSHPTTPSAVSDASLPFHAFSALALALAVLAKPSAIAIPAALLILDTLTLRVPAKAAVLRLAPHFAIAAIAAVATAGAQTVPQVLIEASPLWKRPVIAADATAWYLGKLLWPYPLIPVVGRTPDHPGIMTVGIIALPILILVATVLVWRARVLAGLVGFALATVGPVLGLTPFLFQNFSTVADRYAYLALAAVAWMVAVGLERIRERRTPPDAWRPAVVAALALATVWLVLTEIQIPVWRNSVALWTHNIRIAPDAPVAYHNLGNYYSRAGRDGEAEPYFLKAVGLDPDYGESWNNLGLISGRRSNHLEALDRYSRALAAYDKLGLHDNRVYETEVNRSASLLSLGRFPDAEQSARKAIELTPASWQAMTNLAIAVARQGRPDEATRLFQAANTASNANPQVAAEAAKVGIQLTPRP